jgi:archaellum component FlaC
MTDTGERLDKVEDRLDKVETRLEKVEDQVSGLRIDVKGLRTDVTGLRTDVTSLQTDVAGLRTDVTGLTDRVGTIDESVQKLRILEEENSRQIRLVAEVQLHHGTVLDKLAKDIEPLKVLPDLLRTVVENHERRITALERQGTQ